MRTATEQSSLEKLVKLEANKTSLCQDNFAKNTTHTKAAEVPKTIPIQSAKKDLQSSAGRIRPTQQSRNNQTPPRSTPANDTRHPQFHPQ